MGQERLETTSSSTEKRRISMDDAARDSKPNSASARGIKNTNNCTRKSSRSVNPVLVAPDSELSASVQDKNARAVWALGTGDVLYGPKKGI